MINLFFEFIDDVYNIDVGTIVVHYIGISSSIVQYLSDTQNPRIGVIIDEYHRTLHVYVKFIKYFSTNLTTNNEIKMKTINLYCQDKNIN